MQLKKRMRVDREQGSVPALMIVPEVELSVSTPPSLRDSLLILPTLAVNGYGMFNNYGAYAQGT